MSSAKRTASCGNNSNYRQSNMKAETLIKFNKIGDLSEIKPLTNTCGSLQSKIFGTAEPQPNPPYQSGTQGVIKKACATV